MIVHPSADEIKRLVHDFEACTLPRDRWTHGAHLAVALWYVTYHPAEEATRKIRDGIQAYNRACGRTSAEVHGYHETVTLFYLRVIRRFLSSADPDATLPDLFDGLMRDYGHKRLLAQYYSRPRLFSPEARAGWVTPDLMPLE